MESQTSRPLTVSGVLAEAAGIFRSSLAEHAKWNALFVAVLMLTGCLAACVMVPLIVGGGALGGLGSNAAGAPLMIIVGMLVIYVAFLALMVVGFAFHTGVTLELTRTVIRGELWTLSAGIRAVTPKLLSLVLVAFLRALLYLLPIVIAGVAIVGAAVALGQTDPGSLFVSPPAWAIVAIATAYLLDVVWVFAVRLWLGLADCAVQHEHLGAIAAMRRSSELLRGRRGQFLTLLLAWSALAFVLYVIAYAPMGAFAFLMQTPGQTNALFALLLLPYSLLFYFFILFLLSFDGVLTATYYERVNAPARAESIARVFG